MNDRKRAVKSDIPEIAFQALDGLLDQTGGILYSSHETLKPGNIYFIGLNPAGCGGPSLRERIPSILTKPDNAYLDEEWEWRGKFCKRGESPLQKRAQSVLSTLGENCRDVLATNLIFTQSRNSSGLSPALAEQCWPVHEAMLDIVRPTMIVAFGNSGFSPYGFIHNRFGGQQDIQSAEHGNWVLRRLETNIAGQAITVLGLPHLSRYQPMGKPGAEAWLKENRLKTP